METLSLGSRGPNVKLLQSLLSKIGYNPGSIDGVFGQQTRRAVIDFQVDNGLVPDGVVGPAT
jgi:g-D-glutamyl-meso-diaminopimelate peptidase